MDCVSPLNTDDPSIFTTTSSQEIITAVHEIDVPPQHIYRFLRYGVEAAFIPEEERPWLRRLFSDALAPYPGALEEYNTAGDMKRMTTPTAGQKLE